MGVSLDGGTHQVINFNRVFHYKPSILGYPYLRKHPYGNGAFANKDGRQVSTSLRNEEKVQV